MYKNLILLFICFLSLTVVAQVPQAINYQAVARNNSGQALVNQTIKIRLSIMEGASSLYSETRNVTTNALGLFNVKIGSSGAISTTGSFTTIQWQNNIPEIKLIKVELDINNTNTFTDMGMQSLATVPYAFAATEANNAKKIGGSDVSTSAPNTGDVLKWNGTSWAPFAVPAQPTVGNVTGLISPIPPVQTSLAFAGPTATVTINGPQDVIIATSTGVFGHSNAAPQACTFTMAWSEVPSGSTVNSFTVFAPDATISAFPNKTALTATGTLTNLPQGTYKIGLGFRNKSSVNMGANDAAMVSYQIIRN